MRIRPLDAMNRSRERHAILMVVAGAPMVRCQRQHTDEYSDSTSQNPSPCGPFHRASFNPGVTMIQPRLMSFVGAFNDLKDTFSNDNAGGESCAFDRLCRIQEYN